MQLSLITVGKNMPAWVTQSYEEYVKRLSSNWPLKLIEIAPPKRSANANITKIIADEYKQIRAKIPNKSLVIALDEHGKEWTTLELAQNLTKWQTSYSNISLIIGGPDGLDKSLLKNANYVWSLSKLTLPHQLVRVMLAEQLYRAWTITVGHPYHRQ